MKRLGTKVEKNLSQRFSATAWTPYAKLFPDPVVQDMTLTEP